MIKFIKLGIAGIFPTRHEREKERLRKLNDKIHNSSTPSDEVTKNVLYALSRLNRYKWLCHSCGLYGTDKNVCSECGKEMK